MTGLSLDGLALAIRRQGQYVADLEILADGCRAHPAYRGHRPPRVPCPDCEKVYAARCRKNGVVPARRVFCPNCDTALPEGCGGTFVESDGKHCWLYLSEPEWDVLRILAEEPNLRLFRGPSAGLWQLGTRRLTDSEKRRLVKNGWIGPARDKGVQGHDAYRLTEAGRERVAQGRFFETPSRRNAC